MGNKEVKKKSDTVGGLVFVGPLLIGIGQDTNEII